MIGCYALSSSAEDLRVRGSQREVWRMNDKGSASAAYPRAEVRFHGEAAAFVVLLRACIKTKDLRGGTILHHKILKLGLLETCSDDLVMMYAKCGELGEAEALLSMHKTRNVAVWTALIASHVREGQSHNALDCFRRMQHLGIPPDAATYASILKACGTMKATDMGQKYHDDIMRQGLMQNNVVLGTAVVDMYVKCGALSKAQDALHKLLCRNVFSWTALITGYAQVGQGDQAWTCFGRMLHEGVSPNAVTYASVLKACASLRSADKGEQIHHEIVRQGLLHNDIVLGTALVDMYAKCSAISKAQHVLEELPFWNAIVWSALITGYAQEGQGEEALDCFEHMQHEGISPDAVTYASALKACATIGAWAKGNQIHNDVNTKGLLPKDLVLGNALVDMHAKCGAVLKAQCVLEELPARDEVSWNALIAGYAQEGQAEKASNCFRRMWSEGIIPDAVTFVCVLNMCSHLGLVEEGHRLFENMSTIYGVTPNLECYTCMVDLFGRAGHLEKAARLILEMPSSNYPASWFALLSACQRWGDASVGKWAFEQAVQVDEGDGPAYVLLANIHAAELLKP